MLLTVGRIARPHGVKGEVVVEVHTDEPGQRYATGARLRAQAPAGGTSVLTVVARRPHHGRLIVAFEGVEDRDAAEALRGVVLEIDSSHLEPPDDPDEFHDHQLVGLAAVTRSGERIGEVVAIDHAPASDLLVVRRTDGRTALVPFVAPIVPEVDLDGGRVLVDPPPGLLEL
jgi:16S rRNA processing protein RimM